MKKKLMRITIQNRRKTIIAREVADKKFKWNPELKEQLINSLKEYKVNMTYTITYTITTIILINPMYEEIRVMMVRQNVEDVDPGNTYIDS